MKKNIVRFKLIVMVSFISSLIPTGAFAVSCPNELVPIYESSAVSDKVGEVTGVLQRVWTLGQWSCVAELSFAQRSALDSEYQALIAYMEGLDGDVPDYLSKATKSYIEALVSPAEWGFVGTSVLTQSSACQSVSISQTALQSLTRCFRDGITHSIP